MTNKKINHVPNNYIYTSYKGNEYMYIDGSWMNCKTLVMVESTHNFKLKQAALKQINEHNSSTELLIGNRYIINESAYTYVGRGKFTLNGTLLSENDNTNVLNLVEASVDNDIPVGYRYTSKSGKEYEKREDGWYNISSGKKINASSVPMLERSVINQMKDSPEPSSTESSEEDTKTDEIPVGTKYTSRSGQEYEKREDGWYNTSSGKKISASSVPMLERSAKKQLEQTQDTEDSSTESSEEDTKSDEIPVGTKYTSKRGNEYEKREDGWYNVETGKKINASSVPMLERSYKEQQKKDAQEDSSTESSEQDEQSQDKPEEAPKPQEDTTSSEQGTDTGIEALANEIKNNKFARRIVVLLGRGDPLSLLAADIMLSGKENEVKQQLNSLNNKE